MLRMSGADRQCRVAPPDSAHTMDIGDTVALDFEPIAAWLKEISAQTHYAGLAATLLKAAMSFPAVDRGVAVFSEQGQLFEAANAGFPRDLAEVIVTEPPRAAFRIPETLMARALAQQRAVSTIDPATQSAFTGLDEISVRALCVPLAHKDRAIGVLYLEAAADAGAFSPACMAAISMIAAQAAVSFESARLFAALRETHKWMTRGQRLGRMGSYRFNTRTRESRGSR
jgi:GAF domain-containing protein